MEGIIHSTARLVYAAQAVYTRKLRFLALFIFVFVASVLVLARLDLLPDVATIHNAPPNMTLAAGPLIALGGISAAMTSVPELPVQITIPVIGLSASVANPQSTNTETLDQALLSGAVRYPTSGKLGEDNANVVIFGHSSYLPIVKNQAYKTFDGIQKLHAGDTISVYSSDAVYTYSVASVTKESAASDMGIPLMVTGRELTLSTCDSFGAKTDRFVVVANFVESHPTGN